MEICYQIYKRNLTNINTYYPSEIIEKHYHLGLKNDFLTKEDAENYIINPENSNKFSEHEEYFVVKIFKKTI